MSDFLDFIQPTGVGYTEIRAISGGHIEQAFLADHGDAATLATLYSDAGWDAYYGVLPRMSEDGKSATPLTPVLWADIDAKSYPSGGKQEALSELVRFDVPPSVIIDSGHGYHAYWRLMAPVLWEYAKVVMVGLARLLHGDHVYDMSRILRLPDTMNWKDPEHPIPVRIIRFDATRTLRFSDFDKAHMAGLWASQAKFAVKARVSSTLDPEKPLPEWLHDLIVNGAPQGTRSEASHKVVCALVERGWSDDDIIAVFEGQAIGEKYREKGLGAARWLRYSLDKARGMR